LWTEVPWKFLGSSILEALKNMADAGKQMYDDVAGDYDVIWATPAVRILWTLLDRNLQRLGDWTGAQVLDLACGTGIGLREARKLGATGLVGVDISKEMIGVCKATSKDADQFQLHVADCSQPLDDLGLKAASFDLVIGMWLLNYAESASQLEGFWSNIAKYLKPGAKFVGIIQNQEKYNPESMKTIKYGARESNITNLPSGDGVKMHLEFDTVPKVEFDTYVLKKEIFEATATKSGIRILEYIKPDQSTLSAKEQEDIEWWKELLEEYPNCLVIATTK
jgi:SAM-dependent methyltransferase